jgi:nucleotide-binding universal stress UspA family protein
MKSVSTPRRGEASPIIFKSVICGIDASPQSGAVACQATQVAAADAQFWAVSVWDPGQAMHSGIHAAEVATDLRQQSASALRDAQQAFPSLEPILIKGSEVAGLLEVVADLEADLVAIGSHGSSRPAGMLFGSVATVMAHHAPCSVLIAREAEAHSFPGVIVHAGDGSPESLDAAQVAGRIAARHDADIVTLHVGDDLARGSAVAEQSATLIEACGCKPVQKIEPGSPHRRITEVAGETGASLLVMGSRGLTGLKALGSVSERVVHGASCSVLIVRRPSHPSTDADHE